MTRAQKTLIVTLALLVAMAGVFSAGLALGAQGERPFSVLTGSSEEPLGFESVEDAYEKIVSSAVDPPDEEVLARAAIKGMIEALKDGDDPYALFFNPRGYRALQELTTGRFTGIGVWLKTKDDDRLEIVGILPDTPAEEAGLQAGDVIVSVDGRSLEGVSADEAVGLIKGRAGSEVALEIDRDGDEMQFGITRAEIDLPNLEAELRDDGIGYVRLFGFARNAGRQLRDEVEGFARNGARGIVLDMRDNGGGLFTEAVNVASVFIEDGTVVVYRDSDTDDVTYEAKGNAIEDIPLVVLVNEGTASASEIVAGAIQDHDRGTLVGNTTYGKGSVQEVLELPDASAVKFTTAAYLTPEGRNINGQGVEPDVEVGPGRNEEPDVQLQRALQVLRELIAGRSTRG